MRRNSVLENLYASAEGKQLHYGEYDALRAYSLARELDLDYPLVLDINADSPNIMLTTFRNARIGKFYYSYPSTCTNDVLATCFVVGWRICDVIPSEVLLGAKSYKTCSQSVLVLKRVE